MKKNKSLIYNGKALLKERKKQKISITDIALRLTLNENQVQSIEENLQNGFINDYFRELSIKRYAKLLAFPIRKIIPENLNNNIEPTILDDVKRLDIKKNLFVILFVLFLFFIVVILIFNQAGDKHAQSSNINSEDVVNLSPQTYEADDHEMPIILDEKYLPVIPAKDTEGSSGDSKLVLDFICTIDTTDNITNFSTKNPEKPSNYFHIITSEAQTFCAIDSKNILKTYNLAKGERLTHKGTAPFKIQLDPIISELYFEGWKVQLQSDDFFIKLHPDRIKKQD